MNIGVHLPNDGRLTAADLAAVQGLGCVKTLVRLDLPPEQDPADFEALAGLPANVVVILRLYMPGQGGVWVPVEFVARTRERLPRILDTLAGHQVLIEIHNEPNHCTGAEGWGKTQEQAKDFARWYIAVSNGLRGAGFDNLGFPGLALQEFAHGERIWANANMVNILSSDWLGVHCYWQSAGDDGLGQMRQQALGQNWLWYKNRLADWGMPGLPIWVTEAGNSNCDTPGLDLLTPGQQAREYVQWCRDARRYVAGVTFFMFGGSEDWRGFAIHPETLEALRQEQARSRGQG